MCQLTASTMTVSSRIRSIESVWGNDSSSMLVGPATLALERSQKRRRVSENEETSSFAATADLFASLVDSNEEEAFPTIAWDFDDVDVDA